MNQNRLGATGAEKLNIEIFADDGMTYARFVGIVDEDFDGKKLAAQIKDGILVLQLADITRISSFGIREWIEFMDNLPARVEDVIMVECAPRIVDQINMVANFAGDARVFSFYAPYRCDYCDKDNRAIMQVDRDWDVIQSMRPPELPCPTCGEIQYFDEDPNTFFSFALSQGRVELPEQVAVLLSTPSQYRASIVNLGRRLEMSKQVDGQFTNIQLSGDLDNTFPRAKLADGLEGFVVIDMSGLGKLQPAGAAEWRMFMQTITPNVEAIYLTGMPPLLLEKLANKTDLGPKAQMLSCSMMYTCTRCGVTVPYIIDMEKYFELLRFSTAPEMKCRDCKAPAKSTTPKHVLQQIAQLSRPEISARGRVFIESIQAQKSDKKVKKTSRRRRKRGVSRGLFALVVVLALVAASMATYLFTRKPPVASSDSKTGLGPLQEASADSRPDWIITDSLLSSECQTNDEQGIVCSGVSSLTKDKQTALAEARASALEEAVRKVGLLIDDADWSDTVGSIYRRIRQSKLADFENEALRAPGSARYERAKQIVINARLAVTATLQRIAGDDLDTTKPRHEYWERRGAADSDKDDYLAFAQFELSSEMIEKLIETYTSTQEALGAKLMTVFPGISWRYPNVDGGAVVIELTEGHLEEAGVLPKDIITAVQGRPVKDVRAFVQVLDYQLKTLSQEGGDLELTLQTPNAKPHIMRIAADTIGDDAE